MTMIDVTFVRIYCTETEHPLRTLLERLHAEQQVAGVTAFRGIAGFGGSGRIHEAGLLDISADLPIVIEFFDRPGRVEQVLEDLAPLIKPGHLVSWPARINLPED